MKKILMIVLVFTLALVGCSGDKTPEQSVEVINAIADLDELIEAAERIHPDLYKYSTKEAFENEVAAAKAGFKTGDQVEFYQLVAPVFASLNDGKTIIEPLSDYFKFQVNSGDRFFPFQVKLNNRKLTLDVSFIGAQDVPSQAEVVSINGVSIDDLYAEMTRYISGLTQAEKESGLVKEFHRLYYVLYGTSETFDIEYKTDEGTETATIAGAGIDNIELQPLPEVQTHSYEEIEDGVGLIKLYKFDGFSTFKRFMEATFVKLEENPIDTLIIDVRDNIGGNTDYTKYLMSYITDQPFRLYGSIEAKISDEVLISDTYMRDNFSDQVGDTIPAEFNEESRPFEDVKPFEGDVYVLIDNKTYAAASEFAAVVKDYKVATLVGHETASNPSGFKSIHLVVSTNLNTRLAVPYQYFMRPSEEDFGKGVTPDVEVEVDALDYVLENK